MERTTKIAVDRRLDANTSPNFEKRVQQILEHPTDLLIMDLNKLSYVSSAGIRVLISVNKALVENEGQVVCLNMQPQIAKVMEAIQALPGLHVFKNDEQMDAFLAKIQQDATPKRRKRSNT